MITDDVVVFSFGGKVQVELDPGLGGFAIARDADLVQIPGDFIGTLVVVLVFRAPVHIDMFSPGEKIFHAHGNQPAITVLGLGFFCLFARHFFEFPGFAAT